MMKQRTSAEYCDMSEAAFLREVAAGRLPPSVMFGGREHWHKGALDKALAMLAGEREDDAEREFWNRGKAA
jgi:hypothetical protein